jgi:hypothetical protein
VDPLLASLIFTSGGLVLSALAHLALWRKGKAARQLESSPPTAPGEAHFKLEFFAHPEVMIDQLKQDLGLFAVNDRLEVTLEVTIRKGWSDLSEKKITRITGTRITGTPHRVFMGIQALIMDDDSPLVKRGSSSRQRGPSHSKIRAWGDKTNQRLQWRDSDSPLDFIVRGVVRGPFTPPVPVMPVTEIQDTVDPALRSAVEEVELLEKKHRAFIQSRDKL